MKFFAILVVASLSATSGFASSAVKVTSQKCGDTQNIFESTGFAFFKDDKQYVVAPSQFIYSSSSYCHQAYGVEGKWVPLKLLAWDYRGLSLLEIQGRLSEATEYDIGNSFSSTATGPMTKVDLEAYPLGSNKLNNTIRPTFLTNDSDRGTFNKMIEISGPAIDQGFVGGVVKLDKYVIGLVSNQYINIQPGHGSTLEFWHLQKPKLVANPLVILIDDVHEFFTNYEAFFFFKWEQEFFVDPEDQKNGIERVSTGEFEFTSDCPPASTNADPGTYPIGGTDPIGIGGGAKERPGCIVKVRKLTTPQIRHAKVLDKNGDYARLVELSSKSERIEVSYTYKKSTTTYLERFLNHSMYELLSKLEKSQYSMMFHAYSQGAQLPGLSTSLQPIRASAVNVRAQAKEVFVSQFDEADEITLGLLREMYFVASAVMSENYKDVSIAQLEMLLDRGIYGDAWYVIADKKQGKHPNLYKDFEQLKNQLKAL